MPIFSSLGPKDESVGLSPKPLDYHKTRLPEVSASKYSTDKIKREPQEAFSNASKTPDDYTEL